ncbi:MAG: DUF2057 domain-containing protein [Gammaproteobacteria bacterium]|nr:DUF2057 domain-containing protein [Gammaproteobacteria bacterium]
MRPLFILAAAGLLGACAQNGPVQLYAGSSQPDTQLVTLDVPPALEILHINGQPVPAANRMTGNQPRQLQLQPGEYRVSAYYKNIFDIDGGLSHEVVRSTSALFHIKGEAGERWTLGFATPHSLEEARKQRLSFTGWAENTRTGERIAGEAEGARSGVPGLLAGGPALAVSNAVEPLATRSRVRPEATLPNDNATLTTLQHLWLMLDDEGRRSFLRWAQD